MILSPLLLYDLLPPTHDILNGKCGGQSVSQSVSQNLLIRIAISGVVGFTCSYDR
jgi:hypothetical protein